MSLGRRIAVIGLIALAVPAAARAQDEADALLGKRVAAIRFEVEGRVDTSPQLVALVEVRVGEPLRLEAIRESVSHLAGAGRFEDVEVIGRDTPEGVEVSFRLTPRHSIDALKFRGDTGLPPADLEQLVKGQFGGTTPTAVPISRVEAAVTALLQAEGYLNASLTSSTERTHNPDRATLVFVVSAGARTTIAHVTVSGAPPVPIEPAKIIARTETQEGRPYRKRELDARLAGLRDEWRAKGFYEASIKPVTAFSPDQRTVDLTLAIVGGPLVTLDQTPDSCKLPSGKLADYVPIRLEGSADRDLLDDSRERIANVFRRAGYWKADVTYSTARENDILTITFALACGLRYRVERVDVPQSSQMSESTMRELLDVKPGEAFAENRVNAGMFRIFPELLKLGFFDAKVTPLYEDVTAGAAAEGRVVVQLQIAEGPRASVTDVTFSGNAHLTAEQLRSSLRTRPSQAFVAADVTRDVDALRTWYGNLGYREVAVTPKPDWSADRTAVKIEFVVAEGPQFIIDNIRVVGNRLVSEESIRHELRLVEGQPFGVADEAESKQRLYDMRTFRRVNILPEPLPSGDTRVHLIVTVEESPAMTVGYGGGLEMGRQLRSDDGVTFKRSLYFAPRGFFEIGRRNLWGKNRSINFSSRVGLKTKTVGTGYGFSEYRVNTTYQEPRAFHTDTNILFGATSEQAVRPTFNFLRRELNAEFLRRLSRRVTVSGQYSLSVTRVFDLAIKPEEQLLIDRLFPQVRLSILSSGVVWDTRNDPVAPTQGNLMSGNGEFALRGLGSEVGYVKAFAQTSLFRALTGTRRFVAAGRMLLGMARGFEREVTTIDENGQPSTRLVADLPASQRFFAGGSTTVRGFLLDQLGAPSIVNADGLSVGGNGLVVFNLELRTIVSQLFGHAFGVVGFFDSGNVFAKAADVDLTQLRSATGFGVRYDSPFGPLRLDFGFKLNRRVIGNNTRERAWEWHLSFGQAF